MGYVPPILLVLPPLHVKLSLDIINMIINAAYPTNWNNIANHCCNQMYTNKTRENQSRIPHHYVIGDSVHIRKSSLEQNLHLL